MAKKTAVKDPKKMSVEDKLRAMYRLQLIDSEIDKIRTVRGELPLQVQDLEDDIEGLNTRINKMKTDVEGLEKEINNKKVHIKECETAIAKYKEQQDNVRNNREFDSLNKEIEFQTLEIQLAEKRIKEYRAKIDSKQIIIDAAEEELADRQKDLDHKTSELEAIINETEKDEKKLTKASEEAGNHIDERLLKAYKRIRTKVKNGLAVVPVERESAGGSFIKIPPQRILDIAARKKIIVDEHSGRILVDLDLANEEAEKLADFLK